MTQSNTSENSNETKLTRFSFSRIKCFKECPKKYEYEYILKLPKIENNSALIKGSKIHSLLENIETFEYDPNAEYHDIIRKFQNSKLGSEILSKQSVRETTIRLNSEIIGGDWDSNETRVIGYIDRVNADKNGIELIDYKTGKYKELKYQEFDQLIIYAIYIFDKYPMLQEILLRFVYVEHLQENTLLLKRESIEKYRQNLKSDIELIESTTEFTKNPNVLCNWCAFKAECQKQ